MFLYFLMIESVAKPSKPLSDCPSLISLGDNPSSIFCNDKSRNEGIFASKCAWSICLPVDAMAACYNLSYRIKFQLYTEKFDLLLERFTEVGEHTRGGVFLGLGLGGGDGRGLYAARLGSLKIANKRRDHVAADVSAKVALEVAAECGMTL